MDKCKCKVCNKRKRFDLTASSSEFIGMLKSLFCDPYQDELPLLVDIYVTVSEPETFRVSN